MSQAGACLRSGHVSDRDPLLERGTLLAGRTRYPTGASDSYWRPGLVLDMQTRWKIEPNPLPALLCVVVGALFWISLFWLITR